MFVVSAETTKGDVLRFLKKGNGWCSRSSDIRGRRGGELRGHIHREWREAAIPYGIHCLRGYTSRSSGPGLPCSMNQ